MLKELQNPTDEQMIFNAMYKSYYAELSIYSKELQATPMSRNKLRGIRINPFLRRYFILNEGNEPIGFVLIGFPPNTLPDTDYFIAELYIRPDYRRLGYAKRAIHEIVKRAPGIYCFLVLNANMRARRFWEDMADTLKWKDITENYRLADVPEETTCYIYECRQHSVSKRVLREECNRKSSETADG